MYGLTVVVICCHSLFGSVEIVDLYALLNMLMCMHCSVVFGRHDSEVVGLPRLRVC